MKRAVFVYNPLSGRRHIPSQLDYIVAGFRERGVLAQPYSFNGDSLDGLSRMLESTDCDLVVAAGGDGTLNLVASVLLRGGHDLPLGIIPSGTSNDLAGCLHLPPSVEECIDIIASGSVVGIDVGRVNDREYFLSTCAGGIFVGAAFSASLESKKYLGSLAYYLEAMRETASVRTFDLRITADGEVFQEEVILFLVANGKNAGGFSGLVESADISDGFMDILLVRKCSYLEMVKLLAGAFNGDGLNGRQVMRLKARECLLESAGKVPLTIDGEQAGGLPVRIEMIPGALKVIAGSLPGEILLKGRSEQPCLF